MQPVPLQGLLQESDGTEQLNTQEAAATELEVSPRQTPETSAVLVGSTRWSNAGCDGVTGSLLKRDEAHAFHLTETLTAVSQTAVSCSTHSSCSWIFC